MVQYLCNSSTKIKPKHTAGRRPAKRGFDERGMDPGIAIKLSLVLCRIQLILIRGSVSLSKSLQYSLDTFSSLIPLYPLKTALRACKHYFTVVYKIPLYRTKPVKDCLGIYSLE